MQTDYKYWFYDCMVRKTDKQFLYFKMNFYQIREPHGFPCLVEATRSQQFN